MATYPAVSLDHEFTSWKSKLAVIALSFVLTGTVYGAIYKILRAFQETLRSHLSPKETLKLNVWCRDSTVCIFSFVASSTSIWYVAVDDTLMNDVVNGRSTLSLVVICSSVGFYMFDSMLLLGTNSTMALVHHGFVILAHSVCIYYDKAYFFGVQGLLFQVAIFFRRLRWTLFKVKTDHSSIWMIYQFLVIHLYHCRMVLELYWVYKVFQNWDYIITEIPICAAVLLCMWFAGSFFWFTPRCIYRETEVLFEHWLEQHCDGFSHPKPELQHDKQE